MNFDEYERMYRAEEVHWWYAGMRAIAFTLLDHSLLGSRSADLSLLDAGCGSGVNLLHLAARGRAFGIDLSPEALRFSRARGMNVARASLLALPFADASFDWVTSFDVLYHRWIEDDLAATRELARVLRPGGGLLVRVPALRALWGAHDEAVHSRHRYTRAELVRLLETAGLGVERATYANTLLLPLVWLRRRLDRWTGRRGSDLEALPAPLESAFHGILSLEARLLRRIRLPLGASVVALARKAGA